MYTKHQSAGRRERENLGPMSRFGFLTSVHQTKTNAQALKKEKKHGPRSFSFRGCGSREHFGVSVSIPPLSPDQIQRRATKDDVTIPQLSQPLSVAPPNACVCV